MHHARQDPAAALHDKGHTSRRGCREPLPWREGLCWLSREKVTGPLVCSKLASQQTITWTRLSPADRVHTGRRGCREPLPWGEGLCWFSREKSTWR